MNMRPNVLAVGLALVSASCISNYDFQLAHAPTGEPVYASLRDAADAAEPKSSGAHELMTSSWIPLVHLDLNHFGPEEDAGYLAGSQLVELDSVGPLFMNFDADSWRWDAQGELYERTSGFVIAWGLYSSSLSVVRVPTGWRHESRRRWLWIFGSPKEVRYVPTKVE